MAHFLGFNICKVPDLTFQLYPALKINLKLHFYLLSVVVDLAGGRVDVETRCRAGTDEHYTERAVLGHTLEFALAVVDGESARAVVPLHGDGGVESLLVVVVVTLVLVERELGVSTGINAYLHVIPRTLGGILHLRPHRED